jgi:hypothetical protein
MREMERIVAGSWKFSLLPSPPRRTRAQALGFWGGQPFGNAEGSGRSVPFFWNAGKPVEVTAPGFKDMSIGRGGTSRDQAAGSCYVRGNQHAVLLRRKDAGFEAVDLHPKAYEKSRAMGCSGTQQVGYGTPKGARADVALLWSGTAESAIELRAPDPKLETTAYAIAAGVQIGYLGGPGRQCALLWRGSTESVVELHPKKAKLSACEGTDGIEQVGTASITLLTNIPSLWRGSADSWVDLTPKGFPGGAAYACASGFQAGCVALDKDNQRHHAALWTGTAAGFLDLHTFVPKQDFSDSCAFGLLIEGKRLRIAGEVSLMKDGVSYSQRAALWEADLTA